MAYATKVNVYEVVTEKILTAMSKGIVPWQKCWKGGNADLPRNGVSRRPYSGINSFLLSLSGYGDPRFYTFNQINALGAKVRKGEHGSMVVFWKPIKVQDKETGKEKMIPLLKHYTVFNAEQTEGIVPLITVTDPEFDPLASAEAIVANMPNCPKINHRSQNRAFYRPSTDEITLPLRAQFESAEGYYATLFHELGHSTGYESRIGREGIGTFDHFGSDKYGNEELVAELTSAFLCAAAGIDNRIEDQAAYLDSWMRTIRAEPKILIGAASKAQKAADYIIGEPEPETVAIKEPEAVAV